MKHLLLTTIAAVLLMGCGESPIHEAAKVGTIEAVKKHLAAGVGVNEKGKYGRTPLHEAVLMGHKEIVELLISKGADVNAKDNLSGTSLHFAALPGQNKTGKLEIAKLLITKGADMNAKEDNNGWTALHACVMQLGEGNEEVAELLIIRGADVNVKDVRGHTPLDLASGEITDLLRKHGAKTAEELKAAAN